MDKLLYDILTEVNWYLQHMKDTILPIGYLPKLKNMVKHVSNNDRQAAELYLRYFKSFHENIRLRNQQNIEEILDSAHGDPKAMF